MNRPKPPSTPPVPFVIPPKKPVATPSPFIPTVGLGSASIGKFPSTNNRKASTLLQNNQNVVQLSGANHPSRLTTSNALPKILSQSKDKWKKPVSVIQPLLRAGQYVARRRLAAVPYSVPYSLANMSARTLPLRRNISSEAYDFLGRRQGTIDTDHAKVGHVIKGVPGRADRITGVHLPNVPGVEITDAAPVDGLGIRVGSVKVRRAERVFNKNRSTFFPTWFAELSDEEQLNLYQTAFKFAIIDKKTNAKVGIIKYGFHRIPVRFKIDWAGRISPYPIHLRDYHRYETKIIFPRRIK